MEIEELRSTHVPTVVSQASAHSQGMHPCTAFQGINVAASIPTYAIYMYPG